MDRIRELGYEAGRRGLIHAAAGQPLFEGYAGDKFGDEKANSVFCVAGVIKGDNGWMRQSGGAAGFTEKAAGLFRRGKRPGPLDLNGDNPVQFWILRSKHVAKRADAHFRQQLESA